MSLIIKILATPLSRFMPTTFCTVSLLAFLGE
jgi:hypothetical protein